MRKTVKLWKSINDSITRKRYIKELKYSDIKLNEYKIIDVRSRREFKEMHLNGSINIPFPEIKKEINKYVKNKDEKLLICCQSGIRSANAVSILDNLGYTEVYNLKNGIENI